MPRWLRGCSTAGGGGMRTPSAGRRPWAVRALGSNPLIRLCDRVEALAILLAVVVIAVALPVAASIGRGFYDDREQSIAEQVRTRHPVEAVAVTPSSFPSRVPPTRTVQARWVTAFAERTELVPVDHEVK